MTVRRIEKLPGAEEPVTLTLAKSQIRGADCADEDALIEHYISVARSTLEDRLQRTLVRSRMRLMLDAFEPTLELTQPPCVQVESLRYYDTQGALQTLDQALYQADTISEPARLTPITDTSWPQTQERLNAVQVEYIAGYENGQTPEPLVQWILLAVGDLYEQRTRSSEKPVIAQHFAEGLIEPYRILSI
jgi:uncharacterized phiE125 gp8 family phage protein